MHIKKYFSSHEVDAPVRQRAVSERRSDSKTLPVVQISTKRRNSGRSGAAVHHIAERTVHSPPPREIGMPCHQPGLVDRLRIQIDYAVRKSGQLEPCQSELFQPMQ
jgi:hypothetical protein